MVKPLSTVVGNVRWVVESLSGSGTWTNPGNILGGIVYITACAGGASGGTESFAGDGGGGGGGGAAAIGYEMYVATTNQAYEVGAGLLRSQ
jgi:hypothetical protein